MGSQLVICRVLIGVAEFALLQVESISVDTVAIIMTRGCGWPPLLLPALAAFRTDCHFLKWEPLHKKVWFPFAFPDQHLPQWFGLPEHPHRCWS